MTISYLDNTQVTTTTTGTGTLTQGSAVTGFRAPAAGDDGKTYTVMIKGVDGSGVPTGEFELTESVYTHSGTTWSRGTLLDSSTGSRISFAAGTKRISVVIETSKFIDARIRQPEVAITTTATATIGRHHVCTGTTSDYTVTLPTAVGNAGRELHFRMSTALTKLVTLDGSGTETIDTALVRIMWAGEAASLISDGANWFKTAGRSIPMTCNMSKSTATFCATGTSTHSAVNTIDSQTPTGLGNTASGQIDILRPCNSIVYAETVFNKDPGTSQNTQSAIWKNSSSTGQVTFPGYFTSYGAPVTSAAMNSLVAGDTLRSYLYQSYGSTESSFGGADKLRFLEVPIW